MGQGASAGLFLVNTLFTLYMSVVFLRIVLRWVSADFYNPLSQFIWQITNPPVSPLARVVPRWRKLDTAAVVFLLLLAVAHIVVVLLLTRHLGQVGLPAILWFAVLKLVVLVLNVYTFTIFVQAIMSWLGPQQANPANALLWSVNEPVLRPIRRIIPPIGGLDLSPMFVILALLFLSRLIPLPSLFH
ncbi:YggT family protein [uncultured Abyssibacter sp.]|uniref:YggT family protein n=1 Tax=uncultured Abyssibacter sp. TaxID=2320202 RepID=UPI0032B25D26